MSWMMWWVACTQPAVIPPAPPPPVDTAMDSGHTGTEGTEATPPDPALTVLSLNLHCLRLDGTPFSTQEDRFQEVASVVAAEGVDALSLQEACVSSSTDAMALLEAAVEDATGERWSGAWQASHLAWEGTPDEAEEGVGLLTRGALGAPLTVTYRAQPGLTRVALAATLPQGPLLVAVHLDHQDAAGREDQARQTASWALGAADPGLEVILAGDFNDQPGGSAYSAPGLMGFVDGTASLSAGRIDHIFSHRGASWAPVEARSLFEATPVSDHPGVLVRFEPVVPEPVVVTRLVAQIDVGFGHALSVRGSAAPLDWDQGWWAYPTAADRWTLVLTEVEAPFGFKTLVDDESWQVGGDLQAAPGDEVVFTPSY